MDNSLDHRKEEGKVHRTESTGRYCNKQILMASMVKVQERVVFRQLPRQQFVPSFCYISLFNSSINNRLTADSKRAIVNINKNFILFTLNDNIGFSMHYI